MIRSGYSIVCANVERTSDIHSLVKSEQSREAIGLHRHAEKIVQAVDKHFDSNEIGEIIAHEAGHACDYQIDQWGISGKYQFLELHNSDELLEASKKDIAHVEKLIENNHEKKSFLRNVHWSLMTTIPPDDRYYLDIQTNTKTKHSAITMYTTRDSQVTEIPAILAKVSGKHGMKLARELMPNLSKAVAKTNKLNPNLRDDPQAFMTRLYERGGKQQIFAERENHYLKRKEIQAAWIERTEHDSQKSDMHR